MRDPVIDCLLIADDLTGACDAAVQFRLRGARTVVALAWEPESASVLAFSTDSRDLELPEVESRIRAGASRFASLMPRSVFKKIDSTLRGNPGAEIATALDAFGCEIAIITPAFPEMGRTVRDGHLHVRGPGAFEPVDVAGRLRGQGLHECAHVAPGAIATTIARGHRYISVDCVCNQDLETVVAEVLRSERRVLWAGSAGLASALASALYPAANAASHQSGRLPVLFCVGSDHAVTVGQLAELINGRPVLRMSAESASAECLTASLGRGEHVVLSILRGVTRGDHVRRLLETLRGEIGAMLLCGGDTASLMLGALDTRAIELRGEIARGLPWGIVEGGLFQGLPVATKSGGFGAPDALIQVADFFTCQNP